jgi:hypothetical protein
MGGASVAKVEVTVCDVCKEVGRATRGYRVQRDDRVAVSVDLCSRHAGPLEAFLSKASEVRVEESATPAPAKRAATRRRARGGLTVTTMEEIEAQKKQSNKTS